MRVEWREFAQAARSMHQQPGGIKRTRLMLHLRPYKTRKIFALKATDGRTTLTTRVEHQGQIRLVEALVGDFVSACTRVSVPASVSAASATAAAALPPAALHTESGAGGKAGQASSPPHPPPPPRSSNRQVNKGRKGKRH
ncbi:hypothetical protein ABB37_08904 [Leptomonas pyrrhocoris]|nr:hypothetical protein ABB37_08904 [Leptomonas pyrrhocoris]KPA74909.1 hypothetical protein ABB37_08904 [Leptomonas pyrrhocoris]|eukprot:XP_015653348.1 hypothetical protein ABB37_08904 [Leptomonas pyrrhocoris]